MDVKTSYTALVLICFQLSIAISLSPDDDSHLSKNECRRCKPGYNAERNCTDMHDTICTPCPEEHFTDTHNILRQCSRCSACGEGKFVFSPCTPSSDVLCESCENVQALDNISYRNLCLSQPDENVLEKDTILANDTEKDIPSVELGSGELPVESSGVSFGKDALLSRTGLDVEYTIPSENVTDVKLNNETGEDGSGSIDVVVFDFSTHASKESYSTVTPFLIEDELIPVTKQSSTEFPDRNNATTKVTKTQILSTSTTTSTTHSEVKYHAIPAIAASRDNEEDSSDTVTVSVVVAVGIVASIVFFILGFLASRYCRRHRRSFQIMKNVGKKEKSAPFGSTDSKGKGVDPGIYDEIDKGPNGKYAPTTPPPPEDVFYSVPLKKSSVPQTNRAPSLDNFSSIEGIKYIDETTDDEADTSQKNHLLTKTKVKEVKEKMNGSTPRNSVNLSPIGEERQPMLLKDESIAV